MEFSEHYTSDLLFYFDGKPRELTLYQCLEARMEEQFPEASVKVQKTQISFYGRHLFAAVSLPLRRRKAWPEHCILVTFGLSRRLESPRVAVAVESYPGRWTHHVVFSREEQADQELMDWIGEAFAFSQSKR
nr:DUF5655 domain-containing protein [uncultured Oscillibacter sp.]